VRLEVTLLARDSDGTVYTPAEPERGVWPKGSFGDDRSQIGDTRASVVGIDSLLIDKSQPHGDAISDEKDRADVVALRAIGG